MLITRLLIDFSRGIRFEVIRNNFKFEITFSQSTLIDYEVKFLERIKTADDRFLIILGEYQGELFYWENNKIKETHFFLQDNPLKIKPYQIVDMEYPDQLIKGFENVYEGKFQTFLEQIYTIPWISQHLFQQIFMEKKLYLYSKNGIISQKIFESYFFNYPQDFENNINQFFVNFISNLPTIQDSNPSVFTDPIEESKGSSTLPLELQILEKEIKEIEEIEEIEALEAKIKLKEQELETQKQELSYQVNTDNMVYLCEFLLSIVPLREQKDSYDAYLRILQKLAEILFMQGEQFLSERRVRKYCWAFFILTGHTDTRGYMRLNYFMLMKLSPTHVGDIFDTFTLYPEQYIDMFDNVLNANANDTSLFALIDPLIASGHLLAKFEKARLYFYLAMAYQVKEKPELAKSTLRLVKQYICELLESKFTEAIHFAETNMSRDRDVAVAMADYWLLVNDEQNFVKYLRRAVNIHTDRVGNDFVLSIEDIESLESQYRNRKYLLKLGLAYLYVTNGEMRLDLASQYINAYFDKNNDLKAKLGIAELILVKELKIAIDPFKLLLDVYKNRVQFDFKAQALNILLEFKHKIDENQHEVALAILKADNHGIDIETRVRLILNCFKKDPLLLLDIMASVREFAVIILNTLQKSQPSDSARFFVFMVTYDQENAQKYFAWMKNNDQLLMFLKNHDEFQPLLKVKIWRDFINEKAQWHRLLNIMVENKIYSKNTHDQNKLLLFKSKNEFVDQLYNQIQAFFSENSIQVLNLIGDTIEQNNNAVNDNNIHAEFDKVTNIAKLDAFLEKYPQYQISSESLQANNTRINCL